MSDKNRQLFLATFNCEEFWSPLNRCSLPSFSNGQADLIVESMDEMQFVFTQSPEDVVITKFEFDQSFKSYLEGLGIKFKNNQEPLIDIEEIISNASYKRKSSCELLHEKLNGTHFKEIVSKVNGFSPYSLLPGCYDLNTSEKFNEFLPQYEVVKRVNSKVYSNILRNNICTPPHGEVIYSSEELIAKGSEWLKQAPFIIKDDFGVSGKGNIKIESEFLLNRIAKHLKKEEEKGKTTEFIIEPFVDKKFDFCAQLEIKTNGDYELVSIHELINNGFSYQGSKKINDTLRADLYDKGYFDCLAEIAKNLYSEGYFGHICIDSLYKMDNTILPIIEINARKSMSLLTYSFNNLFERKFNTTGNFSHFPLLVPVGMTFHQLLQYLDKENILFSSSSGKGVFPLSANTFHINSRNTTNTSRLVKGDLYAAIVASGEEEKSCIENTFFTVLESLHIKVVR